MKRENGMIFLINVAREWGWRRGMIDLSKEFIGMYYIPGVSSCSSNYILYVCTHVLTLIGKINISN